jgi:hypothetical protein
MSNPVNVKPIVGGTNVNWNSNKSNIRSSLVQKVRKVRKVRKVQNKKNKKDKQIEENNQPRQTNSDINIVQNQNYIVETGIIHNGSMLKYRIDEYLNCTLIQ